MDQIQFTLENGVDVLVYNGNLDLACNTAGNLRWLNAMRWDGQAEFTSQDLKPWFSTVNGTTRKSGSYKEVFARTGNPEKNRRLAFVTVDRSGHMVSRWLWKSYLSSVRSIDDSLQVPLDQPEVALDLYQKWLFQESFG